MNCVVCGLESGYNRAVIDRFSGAKIGQLCMNCERDEFGKVFDYTPRDDHQCALCNRDGQIKLPRFVPTENRVGDTVVVKSAVEDGPVPCLCDEHFHTIAEPTNAKAVVTK